MRKSDVSWCGLLLLAALVGPSLASAESRLAIAPFYGYRFGGSLRDTQSGDSIEIEPSPSVGGVLSINLPSGRDSIEFLYSLQQSELSSSILGRQIDVDTEQWQLGLSKIFPAYSEKVDGFLVGLLGATVMRFSRNIDTQTNFSMGLGGGVKYKATEHFGLRLDLRGFVTFVDGGGSVACSGGCAVSYQGSVFVQGEVAPSLYLQF